MFQDVLPILQLLLQKVSDLPSIYPPCVDILILYIISHGTVCHV